MPFNGSGTFNPEITFVPNTLATAEDQNTQDIDIANGLTNCMTRDGQAPATADLSMGGYRLKNVSNPSENQDAINLQYLNSAIQDLDITSAQVIAALGYTPYGSTGTGLSATGSTVRFNVGNGLKADGSNNIVSTLGGTVVLPSGDVTGTTDTINIQAAIAASNPGKPIYLAGADFYVTLNQIFISTTNGIRIIGRGPDGTTVHAVGTTGNLFQFTGLTQYSSIEDLTISGNSSAPPTSGYAIVFANQCFSCMAKNIAIQYMYNGIYVENSTETRLYGRINLRYIAGSFGIYMAGAAGIGSYRLVIDDMIGDNPYPLGVSPTNITTWTAATAYTVGKVVVRNNNIYQCMTNGTSGATGPTGTAFFVNVVDGTTQWQFVSYYNLIWIGMDSYSYSLIIDKAAVINGGVGFAMLDSQGGGYGASAPAFVEIFDLECDHNYVDGILLNGGSSVDMTNVWLGSCLTGHGLNVAAGFAGEMTLSNSRIVGNWKDGVIVSCPNLYGGFTNVRSSQNSQASAGTYNGFTFAAGVSSFTLSSCYSGAMQAGIGSQAYGIVVAAGASAHYTITNNVCPGNATGPISDGGAGVKTVSGNIA